MEKLPLIQKLTNSFLIVSFYQKTIDLDIEIKDIKIVKIFPKKRFVEFTFDNRNYRILTSKKAVKYFQKINDGSNEK